MGAGTSPAQAPCLPDSSRSSDPPRPLSSPRVTAPQVQACLPEPRNVRPSQLLPVTPQGWLVLRAAESLFQDF